MNNNGGIFNGFMMHGKDGTVDKLPEGLVDMIPEGGIIFPEGIYPEHYPIT